MGRRRDIFVLPSGKDVDSNNVGLCVAMLSGLGGGILDNLTREALDNYMGSLLECTCQIIFESQGFVNVAVGELD